MEEIQIIIERKSAWAHRKRRGFIWWGAPCYESEWHSWIWESVEQTWLESLKSEKGDHLRPLRMTVTRNLLVGRLATRSFRDLQTVLPLIVWLPSEIETHVLLRACPACFIPLYILYSQPNDIKPHLWKVSRANAWQRNLMIMTSCNSSLGNAKAVRAPIASDDKCRAIVRADLKF